MKALSLKARAIALLAQRDHSRLELGRKLRRIARDRARKAQSEAAAAAATAVTAHGMRAGTATATLGARVSGSDVDTDAADAAGAAAEHETDPADAVEPLLDWLQAHGYLDETRFMESRINARARRYGNLRIQQELAQHGVTPDEASRQHLKDSELERAREVWQRKFGEIASDAAERAKQMRFLAGRGFSGDVIRKVVRGADLD
jgi:regulatory protein